MKAANPMPLLHNRMPAPEPGSVAESAVEQRLSLQLAQALAYLQKRVAPLPEQHLGYMLLFSVAAECRNSSVFLVRGTTLEAAWRKGATRVRQWAWAHQEASTQLRIDWVQDISPLPGKAALRGNLSWKHLSSKTLAVADASLEKAVPLLQAALMGCDSLELEQFAGQSGLLLHLQGIYIADRAEPQAEVRAAHFNALARAANLPQGNIPAPFTTVLDMLLQQQADGSWQCSGDFADHLCFTHALLQAQRLWQHQELEIALARAIGHILREQQQIPSDTQSQAPALLLLCRYFSTHSPIPSGHRLELTRLMAALAQSLCASAEGSGLRLPHDPALARLAVQVHGGLQAATPPDPYDSSLLMQLMELALQGLREAAPGEYFEEACQGIVLSEIAQLQNNLQLHCEPQLHQWSQQLQRHLDEMNERTIWPEIAIHLPWELRRHAVFLQANSLELLFEPNATMRLFSKALACAELQNALAQGLRPESASARDANENDSSSSLPIALKSDISLYPDEPLHHPMSWDKAAVAELMQGQWLDPIDAMPVGDFRGLQASLQYSLPGAAILVRQADYASGVPLAALPALQKRVLISSPPHGLLQHGCPVLQTSDIPQGLRSWARAARLRVRGPVIAAVGRAGKTATLSMVRQCLLGRQDPQADALLSQDIALQMINWSDTSPCALIELAWQDLPDLDFVSPDVLIVTNVDGTGAGHDHGDTKVHEDLAARKILPLLQALRPQGTLVIGDDLGSTATLQQAAQKRGIRIITFGLQRHAHIQGQLSCGKGLRAVIHAEPASLQIPLQLQADGEHMAMNALSALATLAIHVFPRHFADQLNHWQPLTGMGQPVQLANGLCLLEHNHCKSLVAIRAAFRQLQVHAPSANQRVIVLAGLPADLETASGLEQATLMLEALLRTTGARRILLHGVALRRLADVLADLLHLSWYDDLNSLIASLLLTQHPADTLLLAGTESINLAIAAEAVRDSSNRRADNASALIYQ